MYSRLGKNCIAAFLVSLCFGCAIDLTGRGEMGVVTPVGKFAFYHETEDGSSAELKLAEEIMAGVVDLLKGDDEAEQTVE